MSNFVNLFGTVKDFISGRKKSHIQLEDESPSTLLTDRSSPVRDTCFLSHWQANTIRSKFLPTHSRATIALGAGAAFFITAALGVLIWTTYNRPQPSITQPDHPALPQLVWLITGCSSTSGLGKAIVEAVLAHGDLAIATGRKADDLQGLQRIGADVLELDVTAPLDVLEEKVGAATTLHGKVDVLVQNAGVARFTTVEELDDAAVNLTYSTNIFGPLGLARAFVPHWRAQKFGRHVIINSIDARAGHAGNGAYSSSKATTARWAEALQEELEPEEFLQSLIIQPGLFRTQFLTKDHYPEHSPHYQWLVDEFKQGIGEVLGKEPGDPARLGSVVVDMVRKEGVVRGRAKDIPLTLPLGKDAFQEIKEQAERTLEMLKMWEDVITSTDFE